MVEMNTNSDKVLKKSVHIDWSSFIKDIHEIF